MAENKKPVKVIKAGDMSPETKALPDEVVKPPKGIGKSENDMGPLSTKNKIINKPNKEVQKFDENYKKGGKVKCMAKGGSTASKRADGCAVKGKTKGRIC